MQSCTNVYVSTGKQVELTCNTNVTVVDVGSVLQCVVVCCSVLAVCYSVLAVCCSVLQCVAGVGSVLCELVRCSHVGYMYVRCM